MSKSKRIRSMQVKPLDDGSNHISVDHEPDADDRGGMMQRPVESSHPTPEDAGAHVTAMLKAHHAAKGPAKRGHPLDHLKRRAMPVPSGVAY